MQEGDSEQERGDAGRVLREPIEDQMKRSYIDYAMSVIVGRALPDVRDGFKPVHRKILYAMQELGNTHNRPHKKSARVVGEVLGKYHPHGDTAAYDALVRMAQDFSLRYPMVDGQGNFGSVDGDTAAAMRYTECRMSKLASLMMSDIDRDTVEFMDNFDGTLREPTVLPSALPNLLVNGSSGIAVGMATNIPPHNLSEVVGALTMLIDDPEATVMDLMEHVHGPDFPTGGIVYGMDGLIMAYKTGRGKVRVRAKAGTEEHAGRQRLIVTELPYQVNKASLIETIAELVKDKRIEGISDLRDESDRQGMRIVIELKRDAMDDVVLNQLFKHTQMETTFGIINLALVDDRPETLSLKQMLSHYLDHRKDVVVKRTEHDLAQARKRHHILEGLIIAVDALDETIAIIRESADAQEARERLIERFTLSEEQAKAILDMRLHRLTGLEIDELRAEHAEIVALIADLEAILASDEKVLAIVREELVAVREEHGDARRTEIIQTSLDLDMEDLIPVEDVVVSITDSGYVKRIALDAYREQRRGGVGLIGMDTKEEDSLSDLFVTSTHDHLMFFTDRGRVYRIKAWQLPVGGRYSKGKPVVNVLRSLQDGEQVRDVIHLHDYEEGGSIIFCTRRGIVKRTRLEEYESIYSNGKIAIRIDDGDELVDARILRAGSQVVIATRDGKAARFDPSEIRDTGRATRGVIGIRLLKGDEVVSMSIVTLDQSLLTMTENGYGKLTDVSDYRATHRGSQGVITIRTSERNGKVVSVQGVTDDDGLMVVSDQGMVIRMSVSDFRVMGRATQGVRVMRLREGDRVSAVTRLTIDVDE